MSTTRATKLKVTDLEIRYGPNVALQRASFEVLENEIFGIIGPANSGKTSFIRAINRMDEMTPGMTCTGSIEFSGKDVADWKNLYALRSRIGVVFPLPVGLPMSIYENVAFAAKLRGSSSAAVYRPRALRAWRCRRPIKKDLTLS